MTSFLDEIFRKQDVIERKRRKRAAKLPAWAKTAARDVTWIRRHVLCYDNADLAIAIHEAYLGRKR